jgi:hypothetical protein
VAELAERQHGVVALSQLRALGVSESAVHKRAATRRLHRVHRGVYSVGHPLLTSHGCWMAAVLACGPDAAISHRSAAALWDLRPDNRRRVDVTVPRLKARQRAGIDVHTSGTLLAADLTARDGIACTTVSRTLLDLADVLDRRGIERAVEQAEVLRLFDARAVEEVLARAAGRRGAGVLEAVLAVFENPALTASELEERFLGLCRAAGVPRPEVNAWLPLGGGMVKVDFLWRSKRLVVETDGHAFHHTRGAFERDRRRDQRLLLAGYEVLRFTWRQVTGEPDIVAATVGPLLGR